MSILRFDCETRSVVNLKKAGAHKYFEHPTTDVLCMSWAIDDQPVRRWRKGEAPPFEMLQHVGKGGKVVGHNIGFDRLAWNKKIAAKFPIAQLTIEQIDCTMARAQALSLPAGLAFLGDALKVPTLKDMQGHSLMMRLCKPRNIDEATGAIEWWDDPADHERLGEYCDRDIESTAEVDRRLPQLSARERRVWELDQHINERGFYVDTVCAERAVAVAALAKSRADARMAKLTDGAINTCGQTVKIVEWLKGRGIPCESVAKGEVDEIILTADIIGDEIADKVIKLRRATARTSTAKFPAFVAMACADGRVRGSVAYHATYTGRWAGRNLQPQNFPRVDEADAPDVAALVELLQANASPADIIASIEMLGREPMELLARALRTMIVATPGKRLIGGDFKNIEGRIAAWLAGENWKLRAFEAFDAGLGPDLYYVTAARLLHIPIEAVTKAQRTPYGKIPELALGYQGGKKAFRAFAAVYGVQVADEEAEKIKDEWRGAHPAIVDCWQELIDGAFMAVDTKGLAVDCCNGRVRFKVIGGFLYMKLPSGRVIAYPSPSANWEHSTDHETGEKRFNADGSPKMRRVLSCWLVEKGRSRKHKLYGGSLFANAVSGTARDIMVEGMFRVDEAYPIVLTVHDELLSEIDEAAFDDLSTFDYKSLLEVLPAWAEGLPVTADCWEGLRYAK